MHKRILAVAILVALALPAHAWGPLARGAIVKAAANIMTREDNIPLTNLEKDINKGALAEEADLANLIPNADVDSIRAIQSEMYLLQAVYGGRVDPYFAYRLGVLGQLVADATGPLATAKPTYRAQYAADAEAAIEEAQLTTKERVTVDPAAYFQRIQREAAVNDEIIVKDYDGGLGFSGVARAALSQNVSLSVGAVADVWHTILRKSVAVANLPENQVRDFLLRALDFYVKRGNMTEVDSAYDRLMAAGGQSPDIRKRIGDMFYDGGQFPRAMAEYKAVLAEEPGRRDVVERMAEYYLRVGDDALGRDKLEEARDAYALAVETDPLHPEAAAKRLDVDQRIAAREARLNECRTALVKAREMEGQADRALMEKRFGDALGLLTQANESYLSVTKEFAEEAREASTSLTRLEGRIREVKGMVFENAASLGTGPDTTDVKRRAEEAAKRLTERALRTELGRAHDQAMDALRRRLREQMEITVATQ